MTNPKMLPPENFDSEPAKITTGETDFFFGANAEPEESGETLLAFEDLPADVQKAIQEKRKQKPMINVQRHQVPEATTQTPHGVIFAKPQHFSRKGDKMLITKVTSPDNGGKPDNFGNPYVVFWITNDQKYQKGFKPTSDNLATLVDLLGSDEAKWVKKTVTIFCVEDEDKNLRIAFGPVEK